MEKDFNNYYSSPYSDYNSQIQGVDVNKMYSDPMINPIMQYEQAYTYYKFLCMQMEYKMKCKEYDILCNKDNSNVNNKINNKEIR